MRVGLVTMPRHQIAVDANVELSVIAWNQPEAFDAVSDPIKRLASHPGGSRRVSSMVTVLDFDLQLVIGQTITPLRYYLL